MIKELTYQELKEYIPILEKEPSLNLFFINDIKTYTYKKDYLVYKVDNALLLWFKKLSFLLYSYGDYNKEEVASFIVSKKSRGINGPKKSLEGLEKYLGDGWSYRYPSLMEITRESFIKKAPRSDNLSLLLTYEDFLSLAKLYAEDEDFSEGFETVEDREIWAEGMEEMEYPFSACGYKVKGKLLGGASLSAATKESAMVVGVLVDKEYRNLGIGTQIIQELTDIGLNENLIERLCLFPSGKHSKHIYSSLGYKDVGEYAYFKKK